MVNFPIPPVFHARVKDDSTGILPKMSEKKMMTAELSADETQAWKTDRQTDLQ